MSTTMDKNEVMNWLESHGRENTVKIYRKHGAEGEMFGVQIADLKKILKKIKGEQNLALELWNTDNSDAMYLAGLVADGALMTKRQLDHWAKTAWWYMLSEHSVAGVAAEHKDSVGIAKKWMKSKKENIASSGWSTYNRVVSIYDDSDLNIAEVKELVQRAKDEIGDAPNRVRYCMNGFIISAGAYVKPVLKTAKAAAKKIGKVEVNVGSTSCKVPLATEAIAKIEKMGRVGQKRKATKC